MLVWVAIILSVLRSSWDQRDLYYLQAAGLHRDNRASR
jgi:hypothetical protein